MTDHAKNQGTSKADAKKKENGTVLLTPDELRKISGGAGVNNPPPINPNPNQKAGS